MLDQYFFDVRFIVLFGIANQILTFVVDDIEIAAMRQQPFDDGSPILSDRIIQWRLAIFIHMVMLTPVRQ